MKKRALGICFAFCFLTVLLCGCSGAETAPAVEMNVAEAYEKIMEAENMPGMIQVPQDKAELLLGVVPEDCAQAVTAICEVSLQADEIWLVEAVDADAAERIAGLAQARIDQKSMELENYLPEQYKVVQDSRILRSGNYVVLIISPIADELAGILSENYNIG